MATCQNGWPARTRGECHAWVIPGTGRHLVMSKGAPGFVLAHFALWYHEKVERLDGGTWDDWGYAWRPIRGTTGTLSNHAGYAMDLNATQHPLGVPTARTFKARQVRRIRNRLQHYPCIRWGGDYKNRPDPMHFEIVGHYSIVQALAYWLARTPRGRRVRRANREGGI